MKISAMNKHQKLAFDIMSEVIADLIGGYENTISDYEEESEEYKVAEKYLSQSHEELKQDIYNNTIEYAKHPRYKDLKFAGTDFMMERIEKMLIKWGY